LEIGNRGDNAVSLDEEYAMDMYACDMCGYYYDPEYGDEENHIDAGTAFAYLPPDWVCPACGASKDEFQKFYDSEIDDYADLDLSYEEYLD